MTSLKYRYRPLRTDGTEIRLLFLEGAEQYDDPLVCRLKHVALAATPDAQLQHYNALSYWWGPPTFDNGEPNTATMSLDGAQCLVNRTLADGVRQYRSLGRAAGMLPIWVDALCINQSSNEEKSHQVRLMRRIYSGSRTVFVHLHDQGFVEATTGGPLPALTDSAMQFISSVTMKKKLLDSLEGLEYEYSDRDVVEPGRFGTILEARQVPLPANFQEPDLAVCAPSFSRLLGSTWMSRIWVIQEVVASTSCNFMFGGPAEHLVSLDDLVAATWCLMWLYTSVDARRLREMLSSRYIPARSAVATETLRFMLTAKTEQQVASLVELATRFRLSGATNPRDKVYGLLGICNEGEDLLLPDYDCSVETVYVESAVVMLDSGGPWALTYLLPEAGMYQQTGDLDLPSWVPEWCNPVMLGIDYCSKYWIEETRYMSELKQHGGTAGAEVKAGSSPATWKLFLRGAIRHTLAKVMADIERPQHEKYFAELFEQASDPVLQHLAAASRGTDDGATPGAISDTTAAKLYERFVNVVTCNAFLTVPPSGERGQAFGQAIPAYAGYRQESRHKSDEDTPSDTSFAGQGWSLNFIYRFTSGRKLCATSSGVLGLVPPCAREGDLLAVFENYPTYFLLRPRGTEFSLVGPAFVEDVGVMENSSVDDWGDMREICLI